MACLATLGQRNHPDPWIARRRTCWLLSKAVELADRAGINRNHVGMLEREEHAATVDMLEKLAEVLGVDPVEFLDGEK